MKTLGFQDEAINTMIRQLDKQHAPSYVRQHDGIPSTPKPARLRLCGSVAVRDDGCVQPVDTALGRRQIVPLVARLGTGAHPIGWNQRFEAYTHPDIDGAVLFVRRPHAKCVVAFGDPMCDPAQRAALAQHFHTYCDQNGWKAAYVGGSPDFVKEAAQLKMGAILFGKEQVLDPVTSLLRDTPPTPAPTSESVAPKDPQVAAQVQELKKQLRKQAGVLGKAAEKRFTDAINAAKDQGAPLSAEQVKALRVECFAELTQARSDNQAQQRALLQQAAPPPPSTDDAATRLARDNAKTIRRDVAAAKAMGVEVQEYAGATASDPVLEQALLALTQRWVSNRRGPQMFAGGLEPFAARSTARWFVAKRQGQVVGLLTLAKIRDGYLIDHLLSDNLRGVSQMLVSQAIDTLAQENCRVLTWGMAASPHLGPSHHLPRLDAAMARWFHDRSNTWCHLEGKLDWRSHFNPVREDDLYLMFYPAEIKSHQAFGLMNSMNVKLTLGAIMAMARSKRAHKGEKKAESPPKRLRS